MFTRFLKFQVRKEVARVSRKLRGKKELDSVDATPTKVIILLHSLYACNINNYKYFVHEFIFVLSIFYSHLVFVNLYVFSCLFRNL